MFVGGYNSGSEWASNVEYTVGVFVTVGSYTYRCTTAHTSSTFHADIANWTFFIGNIRLKKDSYSVHNVNNHSESPEGDVAFDAEFTVDGTTKQITLATPLAFGTHVTVVKKTLTEWDSTTSVLNDNSKISGFLKATPGVWYTNIGKYGNTNNVSVSFDSNSATFDDITTTFDRG